MDTANERPAARLMAEPHRRRRSAHDNALEAIGFAIVRGDYAEGTLLPSKEEFIAQLSVSQTTLREAIQTLTAKGMVEAKAKVGTRVLGQARWNMFDADILSWRLRLGMSAELLAMLFEIRQSIEPVAAALAAVRRSGDDVERLEALARHMDLASGDHEAFVRADVQFHQSILEISGNPFMQSLGALIHAALAASFTLSAPTERSEMSTLVQQQHMDIVDAIRERSPQDASQAMLKVIWQGWQNYAGLGLEPIASISIGLCRQP